MNTFETILLFVFMTAGIVYALVWNHQWGKEWDKREEQLKQYKNRLDNNGKRN